MKTLALIAILVPSVALADNYCLFNTTQQECEFGQPGLSFCASRAPSQLGSLNGLCNQGLNYQSLYNEIEPKWAACLLESVTCSNTLGECTIAYTSNYYTLKGRTSELASCNSSLAQNQHALTQNQDALNATSILSAQQAILIKKLRKACGEKCKKIKVPK